MLDEPIARLRDAPRAVDDEKCTGHGDLIDLFSSSQEPFRYLLWFPSGTIPGGVCLDFDSCRNRASEL